MLETDLLYSLLNECLRLDEVGNWGKVIQDMGCISIDMRKKRASPLLEHDGRSNTADDVVGDRSKVTR